MAAAHIASVPLYDKVHIKNSLQITMDITILFLMFCLLTYRLMSLQNHGLVWFLAFLCESWFTFGWILTTATKFTPVDYKTYPERIRQWEKELPPVDMFVTTADPELEPPIVTVNTVVSLMAVDYPADKLACYVSDDACSPLVFYSLVEASIFAKHWVPFCKKYNVQIRAPFRYFMDESAPFSSESMEFLQEWKKMKEEYEKLKRNIKSATQKHASFGRLSAEYLDAFSNTERGNHPPIIKVILENKECDSNGLPHLIYISREKRPKHPHYYKAGAMNVLTRVSGLMTNAPFMLNVDCDMYAHNPEIVLQAMCFLLGSNESDSAFVQYPPLYYDRPSDPLTITFEYVGKGMTGIQGPLYTGSGCFHRRKVMYGQSPDDQGRRTIVNSANGKIADGGAELRKTFGNSMEFIKAAADALQGKTYLPAGNFSNSLESAHRVASCGYEYGSGWGKELGWLYGSTTEDMLTGLVIQSRGWKTKGCSTHPPAFLGCAPPGGPSAMIQRKRWATGFLEVLLSKNNPILGTLIGNLQFRQCLAYLWFLTWGFRSIPELCYIALPAYCILTNSNFLPTHQEPVVWIMVAMFLIYNLYTLLEYVRIGFTFRMWWTNQCGARIITTSAWLFSILEVIFKLLGLTELVFEVTRKTLPTSDGDIDDDNGDDVDDKFTFNDSNLFVPGTTILIVHLAALGTGLLRLQSKERTSAGFGEIFCSLYVMFWFMPFMLGLFRKGKYGIPSSILCKSALLALAFLYFAKWSVTA